MSLAAKSCDRRSWICLRAWRLRRPRRLSQASRLPARQRRARRRIRPRLSRAPTLRLRWPPRFASVTGSALCGCAPTLRSTRPLRFENELGCEQLRPQLQRLMESLDLGATAPPARPPALRAAPADRPRANLLLGQACASERSALDRLREEPSAEPAELFWREMQCEGLRPQVRLLLESLNVTPDSWGRRLRPASRRRVTPPPTRRPPSGRIRRTASGRRRTEPCPGHARPRRRKALRQHGDVRRAKTPGGAIAGELRRMKKRGSPGRTQALAMGLGGSLSYRRKGRL